MRTLYVLRAIRLMNSDNIENLEYFLKLLRFFNIMKTPKVTIIMSKFGRLISYAILLIAIIFPALLAQKNPTIPIEKPTSSASNDLVELSPFEVTAAADNSYGALNSNSITQFRTDLNKLPLSADIFTETFMRDTASDSIESMIQSFGAGAGISTSDPSGSAVTNQPGDRNGNSYLQLRGLNVPIIQRDNIMSVGAFSNPGSTGVGVTDNFDLQSVELIRGPQSLLYGAGGAGGVVNVVSKQASFGSRSTQITYKIDQYGSKRAVFDTNYGGKHVAIRAVVINASESGRRENIGGPLHGAYLQFATHFFNTTIRLNAEQTTFDRILSSNLSFSNAASGDPRNGLSLHYLLFTNQTGAVNPITGTAYQSGAIDNGRLNWSNVDSYQGWGAEEIVVNDFVTLSADTRWNSWLTTQISTGYNDYRSDHISLGSFSFYAPTASGNGIPGSWTLGAAPTDSYQPARNKAIRFSAHADNSWLNGKIHSDTIIGVDFTRTDYAQIAYAYYQADANFNPIITGNPIPGVTAGGGRTALAKQYWSIDNGFLSYPLWMPRANQVTINGVNYVRQLMNPPNASITSLNNPQGLVLGGNNYFITKYLNKGLFGVNNLHMLDGRLETLFGFRALSDMEAQLGQGSAPPAPTLAFKQSLFKGVSFDAGVNYAVLPWLRTYISASDSFDPPIVMNTDPLGNQTKTAHGTGGEIGFKISNSKNTISGSLAAYQVVSKNEEVLTNSTIQNDINPAGLNGRFGASGPWLNLDRMSNGVEAVITAAPSENWRIRIAGAEVDGRVQSDKNFQQVYNDQFYANSSGNVTYADGTPVWVKTTYSASTPTVAAGTAGAVPLTIAMMNTPTSPYWANPVPVSGAITSSSNVATVLKTVDPVHGAILTGHAGLPISSIQIDPTTSGSLPPSGNIIAAAKGDVTAGYYHYSTNVTQNYTFSNGFLKGFRLGGSILLGWQDRRYYYYPNGVTVGAKRILFSQPDLFRIDAMFGYERKLRKTTFATQVNVGNLLNRYHLYITPNSTTGFSTLTGVNATFDQQPRSITWTNSLKF